MAKRTIQLFTTPHSSRRVHIKADALAAELRKNGATVLHARDEAHPLAIAEEADIVCAVGGDGTLRYVVDAARRGAKPVAIFPAGTINLVARERGSPRDAPDFARWLLSDRAPSTLRIAIVEDLPLLACASIGPDSYAVEQVSARLKRLIGRAAYVVAFARLVPRWPRHSLRLRHGDGELTCEAVYIAKGRFYAGPWSFAPDAALDAPDLHVVALETATRTRFARFMLQILLRRPVGELNGVRQFRCTSLAIEGPSAAALQTDGDVLCYLPVSIEIAPAAVTIL